MPAGRPTSWSEDLQRTAWAYVDDYEEYGDVIPSVVGLVDAIKISRSCIYDWAEHEDKEFSDILQAINARQEKVLISKGLTGDFNSNITKLVLGKHGYHDKQDTEHTGKDGAAIDHSWTVKVVTTRQGGG